MCDDYEPYENDAEEFELRQLDLDREGDDFEDEEDFDQEIEELNAHMDDSRESWVDFEHNDLIDGVGFADPGGNSSLRAATPNNPRDQPCPTCGTENVLTRIDKRRGYQCDRCADAAEGHGRGGY